MGKSKDTRASNVKNNIFKMAGCKSLKAKNKAKPVTNERTRSIHVKNRQKVEDIDKQLSMLHAEVRQLKNPELKINDGAQSVQSNRNTKMKDEIRRYNETEKHCEEALGRLVSMEMS